MSAPSQAGTGAAARSQTHAALMGIRDLILGRVLGPGDRVSEPAMVERLGVSRTPVRAALIRLELEGLLTALPGGGFEVRGFSWEEMCDAIELRGMIEGMAARLAAERGADPARLRDMAGLLDALDETLAAGPPVDMDRYAALNRAFHDALVEAARSGVLREQLARVTALPFAGPSAFVPGHGSAPGTVEGLRTAQSQHRAVVEAITLRQGTRAEMLMREHATIARRNLEILTRSDAGPALQLVTGRAGRHGGL